MNHDHPNFFLQSSHSTIAKARSLRRNMTPEEKLLWSHLRGNSFGIRFRRQVPFGPYILDFFCLPKRIAIELDGDQHYQEQKIDYDKIRDAYLLANGIHVIRFRNKEIKTNLDGVLIHIWERCNTEE